MEILEPIEVEKIGNHKPFPEPLESKRMNLEHEVNRLVKSFETETETEVLLLHKTNDRFNVIIVVDANKTPHWAV